MPHGGADVDLGCLIMSTHALWSHAFFDLNRGEALAFLSKNLPSIYCTMKQFYKCLCGKTGTSSIKTREHV